MQKLINNFSDIEKYSELLTPDYRQKFLLQINDILSKILDEQANSSVVTTEKINNDPTPVFTGFSSVTTPPPATQPIDLSALKNSFNKNSSSPLPPPPPPLPVQTGDSSISPFKLRTVGTGALNIKTNTSTTFNKSQKKSIPLFDFLGYVIPNLMDLGKEAVGPKSNINQELYKILKQIDGTASIKQIYMILYPSGSSLGSFFDKIFGMVKERYISFKIQGRLPEGEEGFYEGWRYSY
jgi:hypothetical protein